MTNKNISMFIKILTFLIILTILANNLGGILYNSIKNTDSGNQSGMDYVHEHKNLYDVCYFGPSTGVYNISNQELYENYGIACISVAEPREQLYLSRYSLEEVLHYQKPSVIFWDVSSIFDSGFYSEDQEKAEALSDKQFYIHNSIDTWKSISLKKRALAQVKEYNEDLDMWDYYSKLYYAHYNWKTITQKNFEKVKFSDTIMNGNCIRYETNENVSNVYDYAEDTTQYELSEYKEKLLDEIVDLCISNDAKLIFITSRIDWTKAKHDFINNIAEKYNIDYLDINEHTQDIDFKHNEDTVEGVHFNLSGAIKWTNYLGEYLTRNYDIPDRRLDKAYSWYEDQSEVFNQQKKLTADKIKLLEATTFDEYLSVLNEINTDENVILMSVYDEATRCLTDNELQLLNQLGLYQDLKDKYQCSYAAVVYGNEMLERFSDNEEVSIEGYCGSSISYKVVSVGLTSRGNASILIDGQERIQKGRGFNIVVYNTELEQVVSSVFFDTFAQENPPQSRLSTETTNVIYYETSHNVWEAER